MALHKFTWYLLRGQFSLWFRAMLALFGCRRHQSVDLSEQALPTWVEKLNTEQLLHLRYFALNQLGQRGDAIVTSMEDRVSRWGRISKEELWGLQVVEGEPGKAFCSYLVLGDGCMAERFIPSKHTACSVMSCMVLLHLRDGEGLNATSLRGPTGVGLRTADTAYCSVPSLRMRGRILCVLRSFSRSMCAQVTFCCCAPCIPCASALSDPHGPLPRM